MANPMHVLYVLPKESYFTEGRRGRVAHAIGVISGLTACGASVTVLSGNGARKALENISGVCVIEVAPPAGCWMSKWRWIAKLIRVADRLLATDRSIDTLIVRYAVSNGFRLRGLFKRHVRLVRCFEVNSLAYHQLYRLPAVLRLVIKHLELITIRVADLVYVVSTALAEDVRGGAAAPRVAVVPNAAHVPIVTPQSPMTRQDARTRFVYMGVFQPHYDLVLVVEAFQVAQRRGLEAELHLHGDGHQLHKVAKAADGSSDIKLHGRYDLQHLIAEGMVDKSSVLILPCRKVGMSEIGSPTKLYEYMSLGLAIIAAAVAQARDVLVQDVTAAFYEAGNANSLADVMLRLSVDAPLRTRLGRNVGEEFLRSHTWETRMALLKSELKGADQQKSRGNCNR